MKKILLLITLITPQSFTQSFNGIIKDSMNFAILISNYQTYEFEMGHFSTHQLCNNCDSIGLPLEMIFELPNDNGSITFKYEVTSDTLFYATIIWLGTGQIILPDNLLPADSFDVTNQNPNSPLSTEYINIIEYDSLEYKTEADSAWNRLKSLDIVNVFSEYPYRIGNYLYTPSVGGGSPTEWKWITFLCITNPTINSTSEIKSTLQKFELSQNYPNPFNPSTKINYTNPERGNVSLRVFNLLGREVAELLNDEKAAGKYEIEFKAPNLPSGIYFYQLKSGDYIQTRKMILMK